MKALLSHAPGGPGTLALEELPDPVAGPGELLVRVRAAAINYPDVLIIEDKYQMRPPRPFAPGGEIAGEVEALGEGVDGWSVGDRLIAVPGFGGLAEKIVIPAAAAIPLPAERSFTDGAALLLTYATSIHALYDRGKLEAGETLLVLGAAGGVGLAAVELGKARGARVIAAVSSRGKGAGGARCRCRRGDRLSAGPVRPRRAEGARRAVQGRGRPGGRGRHLRSGRRRLCRAGACARSAWEGRYLVVGFPAGIPKLPLNLTLLKSCDVCGVFWGAFAARDPKANAAHVATLFRLWDEGKIAPRVSATYPLERGGEAIAAMAARKVIGKLVVTVD